MPTIQTDHTAYGGVIQSWYRSWAVSLRVVIDVFKSAWMELASNKSVELYNMYLKSGWMERSSDASLELCNMCLHLLSINNNCVKITVYNVLLPKF